MDYENNNYNEEMELNEVEETEIEEADESETELETTDETDAEGIDPVKAGLIVAVIAGTVFIGHTVRKNWKKIKASYRDHKIEKSIRTLQKNGFDVDAMFVQAENVEPNVERPDVESENVEND